ncbi:hypothetical protein NQ315_004499 [Exocentrus adspersus]|uniref:Uncharacterized protein n=1 Tax=Exocentrus adspersus TaxID=1586481 RepID=A0AAV8VQ77_9CUCU|nr:hypothetical protein NQ315_004499 [Exocentrus adspersus]
MTKRGKRKLENFKQKIKQKMRKLENMMNTFPSSDSDSSSSSSSSELDTSGSRAPVGPPETTQTVVQAMVHRADDQPQDNQNDYLETLLGTNPSNENTEGPEIAADLALHWESYLSTGLDRDSRKKLMDQWKIPSNCKYLKAPALNQEVQALLSSVDLKKDNFQQNIQDIVGKGITAESFALTKLLSQRETIDATITQALVDSGKLLTDIFHTISTHRKYQLLKYFNECAKNRNQTKC